MRLRQLGLFAVRALRRVWKVLTFQRLVRARVDERLDRLSTPALKRGWLLLGVSGALLFVLGMIVGSFYAGPIFAMWILLLCSRMFRTYRERVPPRY